MIRDQTTAASGRRWPFSHRPQHFVKASVCPHENVQHGFRGTALVDRCADCLAEWVVGEQAADGR